LDQKKAGEIVLLPNYLNLEDVEEDLKSEEAANESYEAMEAAMKYKPPSTTPSLSSTSSSISGNKRSRENISTTIAASYAFHSSSIQRMRVDELHSLVVSLLSEKPTSQPS